MKVLIFNKLRCPDVFLFFDYHSATGASGMPNKTYVQPWKNGCSAITLDEPYELSFDFLTSGTFWFLVTNDIGAKTIAAHPGISMGTEDPNWVGGFCELSYAEPGAPHTVPYFDITNVDSVGLLCGVKFQGNSSSGGSSSSSCGYGLSAMKMISGLLSACGLEEEKKNKDEEASTSNGGSSNAAGGSPKITIRGTDGNFYHKIIGPTQPSYSAMYKQNKSHQQALLNAIANNGTVISIHSDMVAASSGHCGTEMKSAVFHGQMAATTTKGRGDDILGKWAADLPPLPESLKTEQQDLAIYFKAEDFPVVGKQCFIVLTKDALNPYTISSGASSKGMFVYPAFESQQGGDDNCDQSWAEDVCLNWTATGENAVKDTTCYQAAISSVGRDLITALNLGFIGFTPDKKNFSYRDPSTYATPEDQARFLNKWNQFITSHSDSYGMAYSDGMTSTKVLFNPPPEGTVEIHILKQDDPDTTMPFKGAEVLVVGFGYMFLIVMFTVTFMDVALKQMWPTKFLDSTVQKIIAKMQQDFPLITKAGREKLEQISSSSEDGFDPVEKQTPTAAALVGIQYDRVVSQAPYHASGSVDEDMIYVLANENAFGTVSTYCSATVRGYAMLSTFLLSTGFSLGFLWCHNTIVNPVGKDWTRYLTLVGYCCCFLTGIVMCGPNSFTVYRNRNIALWGSLETSSPVLKLHTTGIVLFALIPLISHLLEVLFIPQMHNRTTMWKEIWLTLGGALCFWLPPIGAKYHFYSQVMGKKLQIIGEIIVVLLAIICSIQVEMYATAACAGMETEFFYGMLVVTFSPFVLLCAKQYAGSPTTMLANQPSVLLLNNGTPVASSGPCPVFNYDNKVSNIPNIPVS